MIDLRVKKLTSTVFKGIVWNSQRTVEILGLRDQERSSVLGKSCSRNEITMEDVSEIWDTLKAEDFIGEQKFFVRNLANQDWMNNNNDILIINLNDKTLFKGENSKDLVVPPNISSFVNIICKATPSASFP